jgi:hypothetical protein
MIMDNKKLINCKARLAQYKIDDLTKITEDMDINELLKISKELDLIILEWEKNK